MLVLRKNKLIRVPALFRYQIGVDGRLMDTVYSHQKNTMWCWAACAEMAMSVSGLAVDQTEFTQDLCGVDYYGRINNCAANPNQITVYLNGCGVDNMGKEYCVEAPLRQDRLTADDIIYYLSNSYPIIVAFQEPNTFFGHAVLITGATILENRLTNTKKVEQFIIRDPANNLYNRMSKGRYKVNAGDFVNKIYAWWVPDVSCQHCGGRISA